MLPFTKSELEERIFFILHEDKIVSHSFTFWSGPSHPIREVSRKTFRISFIFFLFSVGNFIKIYIFFTVYLLFFFLIFNFSLIKPFVRAKRFSHAPVLSVSQLRIHHLIQESTLPCYVMPISAIYSNFRGSYVSEKLSAEDRLLSISM